MCLGTDGVLSFTPEKPHRIGTISRSPAVFSRKLVGRAHRRSSLVTISEQ
jgi:hypothetical protein